MSDSSLLGYRSLDALATGYVQSWARESGTGPALIIAYCSAATLGLRLAERLHEIGEVACLLVDASWPDLQMVISEYADMRTQMGVEVEDSPLSDLERPELFEQLRENLWRDLVSSLSKRGLKAQDAERLGSEYISRSMGWLGFLLATSAEALDLAVDDEGTRLVDTPDIFIAEVPEGPEPTFTAEISHHMSELIAGTRKRP
ncbi:hypothetical protein ACH4CE_16010 [Streptomyces gelaticus]|uniref:hypothetical protein n=1 Tax=Streptomyces gelaticus TaxID=285446 RepID=UPI0037B58543